MPVTGSVLHVAWYRFRATLRRRLAGYLGLAALIGLIGGVALASVTAARRTDSSYPRFLASTNPSDLIVQPGTTPDYAPQFLAQLARLPHVRRVGNGVVLEAARLEPDGAPATYFLGNGNVQLVAGLNGLFSRQDRVTILQGQMADPARANEIVVSPGAAADLGLHVGSHLLTGLYTSSQNVTSPPRARLDLTVTGIGVFNTGVLQDDINSHFAFILGTPALARAYAACCTSYMYDGLTLAGGSRYDGAVEGEYARLLATSPLTRSDSVLFIYVSAAIEAEAQRAIRPEAIALAVFGLIAGAAALIIGAQSIARQLSADSHDAGVLRALGAGPTMTVADGLAGLLAAVVAGSVLAGAVAVALSPLTLFGPVRAVAPAGGPYVDWTVLGLGVLTLALALGAVAAVIGYRLAPHRVAARQARAAPGAGPARAAVASGLPVAGVAGVGFALEPGRGRTAVPVRSVLAGAVLAILVGTATLTFGASLSALISHPALYGWDFNYAMFAMDGYGPLPASYADPMLKADRSIAASTGVYFLTVQIDGQTVDTMAVPPHAAVAPLLSGHGLDGPGQVVLGASTLAQLGKRVGDTVVISGGGVPVTRLRIAGTATLPTMGITQAEHASMGTGALIPAGLVAPIWNAHFGAFAGPNAIFVRLRPGVGQAAALRSLQLIADQLNRVAHSPRVIAATGGGSAAYQASVLPVQRPAEIVNYKTMGAMPAVLAGGLAAGAVAALGLTLVSSVRRRRRDLALLKTLGFTRRQLAAAVAWQSTVVAAAGLIIGVPLGIAVGRWLWLAFARELSAVPDPVVPAASIALAAAAALVLANLVAALPGLWAARTPAAEVLRAE
jgi:FtsX-like permease family